MGPCGLCIKLSRMNIRQLEAFRAVMATGSATSAAQRLNLTQPAVSRLLAQFEEDMGVELFIREKGRLTPTPEAEALFEEVDEAFDSIQRIARLAGDLRAANSGVLRIIVPHSLAERVLPGLLKDFLRAHPGIRASIAMGTYEGIERAIAGRQADLGFAKLPVTHPGVDVIKLPPTESVCVLPPGHRLSNYSKLGPQDLKDEPLIMIGRHRPFRFEIEQAFKKRRIVLQALIETHTVETACALVAAGLGITIVNRLMAAQHLEEGVTLVPFSPSVKHEFGLIHTTGAAQSRLAKAFGEQLKKRLVEIVAAV
jgi:DNA-binding transcriptional LysR family regulator